jgi:hypothetical protein
VFRQLAHCPDVTLLSAFGQASKLETLDHSLSQFGHGYTSRLKLDLSSGSVGLRDLRLRMIGLLSEVAFTCAQRLVQQSLAADGAIACFSSNFFSSA